MPRERLSSMEGQVVKLAEARRAQAAQAVAAQFVADVAVVVEAYDPPPGASFDCAADGSVFLVTPD